jgi:hypothetical protein
MRKRTATMPNQPPHNQRLKHYALQLELQNLHNDVVEFHDNCTFFCDSVLAMLTLKAELSDATLKGIGDFSNYLKENGEELKGKLRHVCETYG